VQEQLDVVWPVVQQALKQQIGAHHQTLLLQTGERHQALLQQMHALLPPIQAQLQALQQQMGEQHEALLQQMQGIGEQMQGLREEVNRPRQDLHEMKAMLVSAAIDKAHAHNGITPTVARCCRCARRCNPKGKMVQHLGPFHPLACSRQPGQIFMMR
jgi:chromosome segregation ATPase